MFRFGRWLVSTTWCWLMSCVAPATMSSPPDTAPYQAARLSPTSRASFDLVGWQFALGIYTVQIGDIFQLPVPYYRPWHSPTRAAQRRYPQRARALPDRFCSCKSLNQSVCGCDLTVDTS